MNMHAWLPDVVQKLQIAVGGTLTGELDYMRRAIEQTIAAIPAPRTPIERLMLRGLLLEFASRCALRVHALAHRSSDPACSFREQTLVLNTFAEHSDDPVKASLEWLRSFFPAILRAHPLSAARRAGDIVVADYRQSLTVAALAARVDMSPWQLQRAFRKQFGMTVREYQGGLRMLAALDEVLTGKSEVTALDVGYKSRKNFYRLFRRITDLTPTGFRQLPHDRRQQIVDRVRSSLGSRSGG